MADHRDNNRARERQKRKARKALLAFLRRLRKACKTFQKVEEWYEFVQQLEPLLKAHELALPAETQARLRQATRLTSAGREGISAACKVLQWEVEKAIALLPAGGALGALLGTLSLLLVGGLIVLAAIAGAAAVFLNATAVEIVIENHGCNPITFPANLPIPGLNLPGEPLLAGEAASARAPGIALDLSIGPDGSVDLALPAGLQVPITGRSSFASVNFDGEELVGRDTHVDLRSRQHHLLVLSCNP
ncbi:MAG: hypothetical protein HY784_06205 [Chloroflexi bacterium]|nr:hypothetical protein [Chloroflexota bacterium]